MTYKNIVNEQIAFWSHEIERLQARLDGWPSDELHNHYYNVTTAQLCAAQKVKASLRMYQRYFSNKST